MKITAVNVHVVHLVDPKNWLFVKIETDDGIVGWGEAYTQLDRDLAIAHHVQQLSRYLIGRDPFHIKHFTQVAYDEFTWRRGAMEFYCALSAIEQAMWDIVGKALNRPVYDLLGGPCRSRIRVYANDWFWGAQTADDYARLAEQTVRLGFTALKVYPLPMPRRWFLPREAIERGVAIVRAIRSAVGPDVDVMVDGARTLAPMLANQLASEIEPFRPYWFEEPCPAENLDALAEVRRGTRIPVMTGETLYGKAAFREVFEKRAADIINPDVASVGGILEFKEIAAMAEPYYIAVSPHNFNSTTVALAATVQLAAVIPNFLIAEYILPFAQPGLKLCSRQLEPKDGYIDLPAEPGLGIDLDERALALYAYKEFPLRHIRMFNEECP